MSAHSNNATNSTNATNTTDSEAYYQTYYFQQPNLDDLYNYDLAMPTYDAPDLNLGGNGGMNNNFQMPNFNY